MMRRVAARFSKSERQGVLMKGLLIRWFTVTCAIGIAAYLLDGIHVRGFLSAFWAAAMLGCLNAVFRPILLILTLPINILSLGFFTFVINATMLKMASALIPGFDVNGFWTAVFGSLIVSTVSFGVTMLVGEKGDIGYIELHHRGGNRWE
jgi:putative membrane protein